MLLTRPALSRLGGFSGSSRWFGNGIQSAYTPQKIWNDVPREPSHPFHADTTYPISGHGSGGTSLNRRPFSNTAVNSVRSGGIAHAGRFAAARVFAFLFQRPKAGLAFASPTSMRLSLTAHSRVLSWRGRQYASILNRSDFMASPEECGLQRC